jgi:hypothetical protein
MGWRHYVIASRACAIQKNYLFNTKKKLREKQRKSGKINSYFVLSKILFIFAPKLMIFDRLNVLFTFEFFTISNYKK